MAYSKSQQTKRRIDEAALALFLERGFHDTRMEEICRRARIATGTVYKYYRGKDELFRAMALEFIDGLEREFEADHVQTALESGSAPDRELIRGVFESVIGRLLMLAARERPMGRLVFELGLRAFPEVEARLAAVFEDRKRTLARNLGLFMDLGLLRRTRPEPAVSAIFGGAVRVMQDYVLTGEVSDPDELGRLARELTELFLDGLAPGPDALRAAAKEDINV